MDIITTLTDWLKIHPDWILLAIAFFSFVESLAMVGVIIPGVALLFAAAALAGSQQIPPLNCLLAAMAGAISGDLISFFLGRHTHEWMRRHWPFNRHPQWLLSGESFFQRYGTPSVIIGRFLGPIRPVLPFVAGMLQMPPRLFTSINILSALLWAPAYILPGYLLGSSLTAELPDDFWPLNAALLGFTLFALSIMIMAHRWLHPSRRFYACLERKLMPIPCINRLRSPRHQELPLLSGLQLLIALSGLIMITVAVNRTDLFLELNGQFAALFSTLRSVQLDKLFIPITLLGDSLMLTGMALLLALAWWYRGHRAAASHLLLAVAAILIINHLLKEGAGISRPELLLNPIASFSFPSAHTSTSTLFFYLMAAFIAQKQKPVKRWIPYSLFTLPVLAISVSRLYLGAHWLSDIIGGLMLGLAACAAVRLSYSAFDRVPIRLGNTLWSLLLGWALWALLYIYWHYEPALAQYQPLTS